MFGNADDIGFVICSKCGARIKADREWCLRCHEPLVAWTSPELPLPWWLRALGGGTFIFSLVAVATIAVVGYLAFGSGSGKSETVAPAPVRVAAAQAHEASAPPPAWIEPVKFIDVPEHGIDIAPSDLAAARVRMEETLRSSPNDASAENRFGLILQRLGAIDGAVTHFSTAVRLEESSWIYHFNLAYALSLQQRWNRAASEYHAAAKLSPGNYAVQYDMAVALHLSSNEPAAIDAFQQAVALAPAEPTPHLPLAISLEAAGRIPDALNEYRRYLEMAPGAPGAAAVKAKISSLGRAS